VCCAAAQTPVILISIDTLRGDRHAPTIDAWAREGGTVFTNAESQIPITLPSHTVLLTSTYPFANQVEENAGAVPRGAVTLASVLRARGYKTGAFIGSIFLEKELGLDSGFDTYDSPFHFEAFSRLSGEMLFGGKSSAYTVRERRPGALVLRAANQWMAAHKGEPAFVFIHLFDMHKPWQAASYDAQLQSVDALLAGFEKTLRREGWWDRSLVVLTSDHGEGLGDHGESDHGYFIYESTLHVPLVIHWPVGAVRIAANVDQPVGLIDVAPTILDALGIPAPASFSGHSLIKGAPSEVFSESVYARDAFGWAPLRALRAGQWKYIDAPRSELYDLSRDSGEKINQVAAEPKIAADLKTRLTKYTLGPPKPAAGNPDAKNAALRSLGYIAPGPRAPAANRADPKDKLPELLKYEQSLDLMAAGRYDAAITSLRAIVGSDPGNLLARRDLAVALIEKKDFAAAATELQQVAAAAPDDYVTRFESGVAYEGLNRLREASDQFEIAVRLAPAAARAKEALDRVRAKLTPSR
jgi:arylsulfatase A-like enzyme